MANYFLVVLNQAGHQWLLGLPEDSFDSWEELRQAFIDNFIATCIKGLRFPKALRSKLLRKRPTTVAELLATAKSYADADDVDKLIHEDVRGAEQLPPRDDSRRRFDNRNPRRGDNRDHREGWDRRRDNRDDFRGKRPRDNDHEVNTVKRPNGR
jgi:hypothetical protein